jgi:hypothetical protein
MMHIAFSTLGSKEESSRRCHCLVHSHHDIVFASLDLLLVLADRVFAAKNYAIMNSNIRRIALQPGVRGGMGGGSCAGQ